MKAQFFVYKITNLVNGKLYIGKTNDLTRRWQEHITVAKRGNKNDGKFMPINAAIHKYGVENFSFEVLKTFQRESSALSFETKIIKRLKKTNQRNVYNITDGGEGLSGYRHTKKAKDAISKANSGASNAMFGTHPKRTTTTKKRISNSKLGELNGASKLTVKIVKRIKKLLKDGYSQRYIARLLNLSQSIISLIGSGKRWGHVR